ncbi:MAG: protealysin inhibitor emfourin [Bacteroidota bacterium]
MTTIHFERTGGLLGGEINMDVNLAEMPDDEAQVLQQLLLDSDFHNVPENSNSTSVPDEFHYVITVRAGQSEHTVRTTTTGMPEALSPLVAELSALHAAQEKHRDQRK